MSYGFCDAVASAGTGGIAEVGIPRRVTARGLGISALSADNAGDDAKSRLNVQMAATV